MGHVCCLLITVVLFCSVKPQVDSVGLFRVPSAFPANPLSDPRRDEVISGENTTQNTKKVTSNTSPKSPAQTRNPPPWKETRQDGLVERHVHDSQSTDRNSTGQFSSCVPTSKDKACSDSGEGRNGTADGPPHTGHSLPSTLMAEDNIATSMESAASPPDWKRSGFNEADGEVITEGDCITEVAERLVREASCVDEEWSCAGRCGRFRLLPCSCHHLCDIYSTCCYDYSDQCLNEEGNKNDAQTTSNGTVEEKLSSRNAQPLGQGLATPPQDAEDDTSRIEDTFREHLETPAGVCVTHIEARLVASCPTHSEPQLHEACQATSVSKLSDIVPVTDPVTGLHFKNEHCAHCWRQHWRQYDCEDCNIPKSAPAWFRELLNYNNISFPQLLRWTAKLVLNDHDSYPDLTQIGHYVWFLQTQHSQVLWSPPNTYPSYTCGSRVLNSSSNICPVCPGSSQPSACQNYYSYITYGVRLIIHNIHCLYCHLIKTQMTETSRNSSILTYSDLKRLAQAQVCRVPKADALWVTGLSHGLNLPIVMSWRSSSKSWLFSRNGETEPTGESPPQSGQTLWENVACDDRECRVEACSPYSVLQNGACVTDLIPYTSSVTICLMDTSNSTHCHPTLQPSSPNTSSNDPYSDPRLVTLETALLDVLLDEAPWRFLNGKEACEAAINSSDIGITFVFWSQTLAVNRDLFSLQESVVVEKVLHHLRHLGLQGWVRVCLYDVPYRMPIKTLSNVGCSKQQNEPHDLSSSSAAASANWQLQTSVCLLIAMGLFFKNF